MSRTEEIGAGNETRTRDPDLGKVVLYQLSYSRALERAQILETRPGKSRNSLAGKDLHDTGHRFRISPACAAFGIYKTFFDRVIEHSVHRREVIFDVREHHGFCVQSELRPGDDLDQFVERTHAARQTDEAVGQLRHERLALVHGRDHMLLREPWVRELALDEHA